MPSFKYNHYPGCNQELPEYLQVKKLTNTETRSISRKNVKKN